MTPADFTDDVDPEQRTAPEVIRVSLGPPGIHKLVEHVLGAPAFRMVFSAEEAAQLKAAGVPMDWTVHQLSDGRFAVWRAVSSLDGLDAETRSVIESRIISDDVM
jgi:hypothetical protein